MTYAKRQQRVRLLQALDRRVKEFRTREEVWPLYVPRDPVSMDEVMRRELEGQTFDPIDLRNRTLLWLAWPDGATWELWTISLPSGLKLYCDTDSDETRLLATGRRDSEIETDRHFLELLGQSAGQYFGIEMVGPPPSRVRSSLEDRDALIDFFAALFEEEAMEEEIRRSVPATGDFRADVAHWLELTQKAKG